MNTMIDILAATFLGSVLILIAMSSMDNALQQFINQNTDAIVQNELASMAEIIQHDLRKMGYGIPESQMNTIIQSAQPNKLVYLAQLNAVTDYYSSIHGNLHIDQIPDTIEYEILPFDTVDFIDTSVVLYGINRTVKITQESASTGQVGTIANPAVFRYLNQVGVQVSLITAIRMVEVSLTALNPHVYVSDEVYAASSPEERMVELRKLLAESYWRQTRVISKNLRR